MLGKAVQIALNEVVGAYAIAVFDISKPNEVVAARLGSPLAIGVGNDEFFIASDASPFIEYTNNAVYLEDEEMAVIRLHKETRYRKIKDDSLFDPYLQELKLNLEEIEKGGYDHFMIKEIFEQPRAILDTYRGRLNVNKGIIKKRRTSKDQFKFADKLILRDLQGNQTRSGDSITITDLYLGKYEADHVVPVSAGGETIIENAELMTIEENRKKGANSNEPYFDFQHPAA